MNWIHLHAAALWLVNNSSCLKFKSSNIPMLKSNILILGQTKTHIRFQILKKKKKILSLRFWKLPCSQYILMGPTNSPFPNNLIKYIRPPWYGMDEGRRVINEKIQCLEQLFSWQTVGGSWKPALISPGTLQKKH